MKQAREDWINLLCNLCQTKAYFGTGWLDVSCQIVYLPKMRIYMELSTLVMGGVVAMKHLTRQENHVETGKRSLNKHHITHKNLNEHCVRTDRHERSLYNPIAYCIQHGIRKLRCQVSAKTRLSLGSTISKRRTLK